MAQKGQLTTAEPLIGGEFQRFLDCLHQDGKYFWELYARVSFCTACRSIDVRNLKWEDILSSKVHVTEQKTKKVREIPFNKATQDRIAELYILMGEPKMNEYAFKSRITGKPITIQMVNRALKEFKKKYDLKIGNFSTHSFRKTFGRYVYDRPGDKSENLVKLNVILKHSSIQMTKRYIGITNDEINDIFSSIDI